ncbi:auxin response factor 16 [Quercus suber]|uniref:Auxin response factor n=1 Tax=Quercus suber TaxID=58331 RepID=A0AAW0KXK7_QUESU
MKEAEKSLDPQLWHACAGGMVQMPQVNSKVFYFPQGHAEHAQVHVDFSSLPRIPALILCRVGAVKFLADPETDEVFSKIRLIPLGNRNIGELDFEDDGVVGANGSENPEKPASFAKTLTQSDANNGGGFSVPRYCAETIFPRLDYTADPPVQTVIAKDVHGEVWKFRHIYRGTPRRHLLTTGWSTFVNQKKLVAGDSIVFLRAENGDLCVGIRRAKRGIGGALESPSGWNPGPGNSVSSYGGFSMFLREQENKVMRNSSPAGGNLSGKGKVRPESVIEAAALAASGQPFEVAYYPRASTPEFCVKASAVKATMRTQWCSGMRFKMAFETEDSSRISWFMGTIASVQVADPLRWPNSPWRLLQGARHAQFGISLSDLHFNNKLQPGLFPSNFQRYNMNPRTSNSIMTSNTNSNENLSCLLTIGNSSQNLEKSDNVKRHQFLLFGQPIITEQQISRSCSSDTVSQVLTGKSSSDENQDKVKFLSDGSGSTLDQQVSPEKSSSTGFSWHQGFQTTELGLDTGHCKVFMESEDVGRTLDLSVLGSYEELHRRLANMFGIERSDMLNHVVYRDATGAVKQTGDEPFSDFMKTAKRLTIFNVSSSNNIGRTWITGMRNAENGLDASNKTGPLSIFA